MALSYKSVIRDYRDLEQEARSKKLYKPFYYWRRFR